MQQLYENAEHYDEQHFGYKKDLNFLIELASNNVKYGEVIAEFGCGTLRVTIPLVNYVGRHVIGVDLSEAMLKLGQQKLEQQGGAIQRRIETYQGDMRTFQTQHFGKHPLVLVPFNAFLHLLTAEDQLLTLRNLSGHLADNGRLLIDIFNPNLEKLIPKTWYPPVEKGIILSSEETLVRDTRSTYTPSTQLMSLRFDVQVLNRHLNHPVREYKEWTTLRVIFPNEWRNLLREAGLVIEREWGDYDFSHFGVDSPRMLFLAKRA